MSSQVSRAITRRNIIHAGQNAGMDQSEVSRWVILCRSFLALMTLLQLHLSCGTENAILTIAELEKCEYHLTATTPALCLSEASGNAREEL